MACALPPAYVVARREFKLLVFLSASIIHARNSIRKAHAPQRETAL
jgi:hypothetical protein